LEWDAEEQQVPHTTRLLTRSDVGGRGNDENWSPDSIPTERMQTSEASATTFKNERMGVEVFFLFYTGRSALV